MEAAVDYLSNDLCETQDYEKSFEVYYYYSLRGDSWAQDRINEWFGEVFEKAMAGSKDAAKLYASASYALGNQFEKGLGVRKDLMRAVGAYAEATRWGNTEARIKLAKLCCVDVNEFEQENFEVGVQINNLSHEIFKENDFSSSNMEIYAKAVYQLGVKYEFGEGVKKDYVSATVAYAEAMRWNETRSQAVARLIELCHLES